MIRAIWVHLLENPSIFTLLKIKTKIFHWADDSDLTVKQIFVTCSTKEAIQAQNYNFCKALHPLGIEEIR